MKPFVWIEMKKKKIKKFDTRSQGRVSGGWDMRPGQRLINSGARVKVIIIIILLENCIPIHYNEL